MTKPVEITVYKWRGIILEMDEENLWAKLYSDITDSYSSLEMPISQFNEHSKLPAEVNLKFDLEAKEEGGFIISYRY